VSRHLAIAIRLSAISLLTAAAAASITGCGSAKAARPATSTAFSVGGILSGVAAISADNAWAVGSTNARRTLIAHWNGRSWKQLTGLRPARAQLYAVAATSARDAWAVGFSDAGRRVTTGFAGDRGALILHWNGKTWQPVPCPSICRRAILTGVTAISPDNAWAVGSSARLEPLTLHWNGKVWRAVHDPAANEGSFLIDVAATSPRDVWAVGSTGSNVNLIVRWNGTAWTRVPSTGGTADSNAPIGIALSSPTRAWAVGLGGGKRLTALIERWNGTSWTEVTSPVRGPGTRLDTVTIVSPRNAWAAGATRHFTRIVILHWNGTKWIDATSPTSRRGNLWGITATSATNAWAVGTTSNNATSHPKPGKTLILHWNGHSWT
jgi:hypothetical protein